MSFECRLNAIAEKVERELSNVLSTLSDNSDDLVRAMRYAVLGGGKRLRPVLLIQTGNLFGICDEKLVRTAAALELVHCYSLIHDDLPCMDDDDFRRGKPTVHRKFDEATAVLAGDALLTLAFEVLADVKTHEDPLVRVSLISELAGAAGVAGMVGGQMIDIRISERTLDQSTLERMQQLKTGALFRYAVVAACLIGKASESDTRTLTKFAEIFGLAYQIADDIADSTAESSAASIDSISAIETGNFVTIFGIEKAKLRLQELIQQCTEYLKQFGDRGDGLSKTINYIFR